MSKKKKILVTGGAGFIGSNLVDELVNKNFKVVVVDDLSFGKKKYVNEKAKFYKLSIEKKSLREIFKKEKSDIVFHLAAQKDVRKSVDDPVFDAKINILSSLNLLQNCLEYNIKKVIFASSGGAIYGDTNKVPTKEDHPEWPVSPYGVAKLSIDKYLHYYKKAHELDYVSLRLANVYGPRQDAEGEAGVVAIFIKKMLEKKQPVIHGKGDQTRDFVYVDDVVGACLLSLKNKVSGVYNIGTSKETSVNQIFRKIKKIGEFKVKEKHGPAKRGEQTKSCLSYKKAEKDMAWRPRVGLDEGLRKTIDWFKISL